jgi:tellurite resistance protein TerC
MESVGTPWLWGGFIAFVVAMLALDLGVLNRKAHVVRPREALAWSAVWVGLALSFAALVFVRFGAVAGEEFLAGYLVEKSLSVDNLFVFVVLFGALGIPRELQHRVLFWGILSALVLRAVMIVGGAALLARFHWLVWVFGGFLLLTGVKLWLHRGDESDPGTSRLLRWVRRVVPSTPRLSGQAFFVREGGRWLATPLFLALASIELADVAFAIDSIPAVFAVTSDPFIVFTSNIFAILGLRSLYFLLADLVGRFVYLKAGLSAVLVFVGVKMLAAAWVKIPPAVSLSVIAGILGLAVAASLWRTRQASPAVAPLPGEPGAREDGRVTGELREREAA